MPAQDENQGGQRQEDAENNNESEAKPLLRSMPERSSGKICFFCIVFVLVLCWCVLDTWNREIGIQLSQLGEIKGLKVDPRTGDLKANIKSYNFPLTLAMVQFMFMGVVFLGLWWLFDSTASCSKLLENFCDSDWLQNAGTLTITYVFSNFCLQSLMMPFNEMSLPIFAAVCAIEVPAAAVLRWYVLGTDLERRTLTTCALMFLAAWLLSYSYAQAVGCLSMFTGHGVMLSGLTFYIIWALLTVLPAANVVWMELMMVRLRTPALLLLAMENLFACVIFAPVLLCASLSGWEDVGQSLAFMTRSAEVEALTLWLCVQMAGIGAVTAASVHMLGAFWTVALRSLRVVYWWAHQTFLFLTFGGVAMSIQFPNQSLWTFVMLCGAAIALIAMINAQRDHDHDQESKDKDSSEKPAVGNSQERLVKAV